jgi:hypothetical protein
LSMQWTKECSHLRSYSGMPPHNRHFLRFFVVGREFLFVGNVDGVGHAQTGLRTLGGFCPVQSNNIWSVSPSLSISKRRAERHLVSTRCGRSALPIVPLGGDRRKDYDPSWDKEKMSARRGPLLPSVQEASGGIELRRQNTTRDR